MDRDTFERAANVFVEAAALDSRLQESFIIEACGGDTELLREVRSLLRAAEGADDYFSELAERLGIAPSLDPGESSVEPDDHPTVGQQGLVIGAYTLTEPVGSGGTGTVWRAERTDGQFEGHVAIKMVNPVSASVTAVSRIGDEAQYLAKLSHPNIARLLDAGISIENHPYLVLEFIDGTPIDLYCNTHYLDVGKRIRLFIDVLSAVAHAHARLIVHRDIKPSNVLVDQSGNVKLLDFGIAKLLRAESDLPGAGSTVELGAALTPEYAAPEQLLGQTVTTATDVYALGLMLYQLLAGRSPRDKDTIDSFAALVDVATQDPPKASTLASHAERRGTSDDSLRRTLQGDLDNILQKALAPEPEDRYSTATEFTSDLNRYLDGETVSAMPPTLGYRTRKFVGRHRGGVMTALLTAIALFAALSVATLQMFEAREQRDAALYQQQRVQASNEFYSLLLEEIGSENQPLTVVELLDRGTQLLEREYGIDQPFIGRIHYDLSRRYSNLRERNRELELLDLAETAARANDDKDLLAATLCSISSAVLISDPDLARRNVAEANTALAHVPNPSIDSRIACLRMDARLAEAGGSRAQALEILLDAIRRLNESTNAPANLRGVTLNDLAGIYFKNARYDDALSVNEEILELLERSGRGNTLGYLQMLANRSTILGTVGEVASELSIKEQLLERLDESKWKNNRARIPYMVGYGVTLLRLSRYDEGIRTLESVRSEAEKQGNTIGMTMADLNLAGAFVATDRLGEALEKLAAVEKVLSGNPTAWEFQRVSIDIYRVKIARKQGRVDDARNTLQPHLDRYSYPPLGKKSASLGVVLSVASNVEFDAKNYSAAEGFATDSLSIWEAAARRPEWSAAVGDVLVLRAKARNALGRVEDAIDDLERAVVSLENGVGKDNPDTVEAYALLEEYQASY